MVWSEIVAERLNAKDYWKDGTYFEAASEELIYAHDRLDSGDYVSIPIAEGYFRLWLDGG
jgi:hypothetical protein